MKKQHKRPEGKWLLFLLLGLFWLQLEFLSIRWPFNIGLNVFYGTRHGSWLLIGPIFYFYLKTLIGENISRKEYSYLLPFFIFTLIIPIVLDDFLTFRQVHYGMLTPFDSRPDEINTWQYVYSFIFIGQFLYLAYFLLKGRNLIHNYQLNLHDQFADIDYDRLKWLKILWVGMLFILLLATVFLILLFFTEIYRRHMDYLYVIPSSLLFYAISYKLFGVRFQQPDVSSKYQKSGLKQAEAVSYTDQLKKLIQEEKLYLRNGLRLKDLADKLDISNHQLSEILNQHMQTTFFDLINSYRVKEAKEKIKHENQYTLLHIAHKSGFNNKTSFVNAFKRFEGQTPSQFLKKMG
ncbi:helix-turn-helix domain-containing protein [Ekhidna sp.]|uniref:AraC family transcriptional regulator n=1 Tax=Ekhidna sp. TaxID=2608089 RepID=UPI003B510C2C